MKDPAFLFYSQDFYTGTRDMLPEERACFIDLLIYQHQKGLIPLDLKRVLMFCAGIDKATLEATLQSKFKQTDKGYFNEKLNKVIEERKEYANKQSSNGLYGQFMKKAKKTLDYSKYNALREFIFKNYTKDKVVLELKKEGVTYEGLLKALLKHLEDAIEIEDEIKKTPSITEFTNYVKMYSDLIFLKLEDKRIEAWYKKLDSKDWRRKDGSPIINWKGYMQPIIEEIKENKANGKETDSDALQRKAQKNKEKLEKIRKEDEAYKQQLEKERNDG